MTNRPRAKIIMKSGRLFEFNLVFGILAGLLVGLVVQVLLRHHTVFVKLCTQLDLLFTDDNSHLSGTTDKNLVLVGVMTAKPFLETRVTAAFDTWVSSVPGKVIFFSSEGSVLHSRPDIPLVSLRGIDDSYPPQRKAFAVLRHMYDHYRDQFRFFMRADDDIYIQGNILAKFLHSINSTGRPLYVGQFGLGIMSERGKLNLGPRENYCMGGPGMILSRETLVRTAPHVDYCVNNLLSTHEDVEVGRCITRFTGATCTRALGQMQKIMYNNYREPKGSFTHSLRGTSIHQAATLHPVKKAAYQYRLHQYLQSRDSLALRHKLSRLQRRINYMTELLQDHNKFNNLERFGLHSAMLNSSSTSQFRRDLVEWNFLSFKSIYSSLDLSPNHSQPPDLTIGLENMIGQVRESINRNARPMERVDFKSLLNGYRRIDPLHGPDYMIDVLLVYRKFKGKRKSETPIRRHALLHHSFLEPEFRHLERPLAPVERVNLILPLAGRYKTFLRFMDNFEELSSREGQAIALVVVLFHEAGEVDEITSRISVTRLRFPHSEIRLEKLAGTFSRGLALQHGAGLFPVDALMVFMDVDISIGVDVIERIRLNTVLGRRVYYPIVFSQYNSLMTGISSSNASFDNDIGYWRLSGYGILAVYNSDFLDAGGFDLNSRGWARDVDLVNRFVVRNISIFRVVDVGLVHIFHNISCDPSLDAAQCVSIRSRSLASLDKLVSYVKSVSDIYRRNEADGLYYLPRNNTEIFWNKEPPKPNAAAPLKPISQKRPMRKQNVRKKSPPPRKRKT